MSNPITGNLPMRLYLAILVLMIGSNMVSIGCDVSPSLNNSNHNQVRDPEAKLPEVYLRGGVLADGGSTKYEPELPNPKDQIEKLILQHSQAQDEDHALENLSSIFFFTSNFQELPPIQELKRFIAPLSRSLLSKNPEVRRMAALAMENIAKNLGRDADEAVLPMMNLVRQESKGPDQEASTYAMSALGYAGAPAERAIPILIERLANAHGPQTFTAAEALGRIQRMPVESITALEKALAPHDVGGKVIRDRYDTETLYEYAAIAIGCFGSTAASASPRLLDLLESRKHPRQREAFLQAMCRIGGNPDRAIPLLSKIIGELSHSSLDNETIPYAIDALCSYGTPGKEAAKKALQGIKTLVIIDRSGRSSYLLNPCSEFIHKAEIIDVVASISSLEVLQLIGEPEDSILQPLGNAANLKRLYLPIKSKLSGQTYLTKLSQLELLRCGERPTIEELGVIAQMPNLLGLIIPNSELKASDLQVLPVLPKMKSLDIYGLDCGDGGLQNISKFPSLQSLRLTMPRNLKDSDLAHLRQLPDLRELSISLNSLGNEGMLHVKHLSNLRSLNIYGSKVSDIGLMELTTLVNLEFLGCGGSKITFEGASKIQKQLPKLKEIDFGK